MILVVATLGFLTQKFLAIPYVIGIYGDDACYLLEARRIIDGDRCADCTLIVSPTGYARGWPLILSLFVPLFKGDWEAYRWVSIGFTSLSVVLAFDLTRRRFGILAGSLLAGTLLLSPSFLEYGSTAMSEPFYLFLMMMGVWIDSRGSDRRTQALLGILAGIAICTRTEGIAFALAIFLNSLVKRRWEAMAIQIGCTALSAGAIKWFVPWNSPYGSVVSDYYKQLGSWDTFLFTQIMNRGLLLGRSLLSLDAFWDRGLALLLVILVIVQVVKIRGSLELSHWQVLGTTAVLLVWPYLMERYWIPVLPLGLLLALGGLGSHKVRITALSLLLLAQVATLGSHRNAASPEVVRQRIELLMSLERTLPSDVVATPMPGYVHIWGHRKTVVLQGASSLGVLAVELQQRGANVVLAERVSSLIPSATGQQFVFLPHFALWLERCTLFEALFSSREGVLAKLIVPAERLELAAVEWRAGLAASDAKVGFQHFEKALEAVSDLPEVRMLWMLTALDNKLSSREEIGRRVVGYLKQYPHDFEGGDALLGRLIEAGWLSEARQAADLCFREAQRLNDPAAARFAAFLSSP